MERFRRLICYANAAHIETSFPHEERPQVGIVKGIVFGGSFTHKRIGECEVIRLWCLPELKRKEKMMKIWMEKNFLTHRISNFAIRVQKVAVRLRLNMKLGQQMLRTFDDACRSWHFTAHDSLNNLRKFPIKKKSKLSLTREMIDGGDQKLTESDWDFERRLNLFPGDFHRQKLLRWNWIS